MSWIGDNNSHHRFGILLQRRTTEVENIGQNCFTRLFTGLPICLEIPALLVPLVKRAFRDASGGRLDQEDLVGVGQCPRKDSKSHKTPESSSLNKAELNKVSHPNYQPGQMVWLSTLEN